MIGHATPGNAVVLNEQDRTVLEDLATCHLGPSCEARRARILLLTADGYSVGEICRMLGCSSQTVTAWRRRFQKFGVDALRKSSSSRHRRRAR